MGGKTSTHTGRARVGGWQMNLHSSGPGSKPTRMSAVESRGISPIPAVPLASSHSWAGQGISVVALPPKKSGRGAGIHQVVCPARSPEARGVEPWGLLRPACRGRGPCILRPVSLTHRRFLDSMRSSRISGPKPAYAELLLAMQARVHDYVIAGNGTAKEAPRRPCRRLDGNLRGRRQALTRRG